MEDPLREKRSHPAVSLMRTATLFYAALFGVAWLWSAWTADPLLYATAAAAERGIVPLRDAGLGVLAGLLVILASDQLTRHTEVGAALARALARLLGPLTWAQCVWLAITSGIAEEAVFRGVLQPHVGLVPAALLFGLAHFVPRRGLWAWSGFAVLAGLLLGVLFDATGNLVAPAVAHAVINAVNLRILTRRAGSSERDPPHA